MADKFKIRICHQMTDVVLASGIEIVHTDDIVAVLKQALTQVRAEESGAAGY